MILTLHPLFHLNGEVIYLRDFRLTVGSSIHFPFFIFIFYSSPYLSFSLTDQYYIIFITP